MTSNIDLPSSASRPLTESPALAERAADLLRTPGALLNLVAAEVACVVAQMQLVHVGPGVTLFREGDERRLDHMLLLDGAVAAARDRAVAEHGAGRSALSRPQVPGAAGRDRPFSPRPAARRAA